MALIKVCRGKKPQFGDDCYLAENSTIIEHPSAKTNIMKTNKDEKTQIYDGPP